MTRVKMTFWFRKNQNYVSIFNIFKRNPQKYINIIHLQITHLKDATLCCNFQWILIGWMDENLSTLWQKMFFLIKTSFLLRSKLYFQNMYVTEFICSFHPKNVEINEFIWNEKASRAHSVLITILIWNYYFYYFIVIL